jgi:hypothetical protein
MNEKIKHILIDISVVFLVPAALFYLYITLAGPGEALFGTEQPGSELVGEGQKFLSKLNELNTLKLDTSVFESAVYKSLVDTTTPPPTDEQGRPHPFIPPSRPAPVVQSPAQGKATSPTAVKNLNSLLQGR